jgi:hypothetical protein
VLLPNRQLTLSVGAVHNRYDDLATVGYSPAPTVYRHRSNAGGAEAAYQWAPKAGHPFEVVGGGVWAGSETLEVYKDPAGNSGKGPSSTLFGSHALYALHLYTEGHKLTARHQLDFSYRLGWYVGKLAHQEDTFQSNEVAATTLLPEFMLAIGRCRTVFGQLDAGYGAGNALGNYTTRLALGSGLGQQHGSTLLVGYALGPNYPAGSMGFVSANLRLPIGLNALILAPYIASNFGRHQVFSLQLHYALVQ